MVEHRKKIDEMQGVGADSLVLAKIDSLTKKRDEILTTRSVNMVQALLLVCGACEANILTSECLLVTQIIHHQVSKVFMLKTFRTNKIIPTLRYMVNVGGFILISPITIYKIFRIHHRSRRKDGEKNETLKKLENQVGQVAKMLSE